VGAFVGGAMGGLFLKFGITYMLLTNLFFSVIWLAFIYGWLSGVKLESS